MNKSYKTAIHRKRLSGPAKYLSENGLLRGDVLDYGCGRGGDASKLDIDSYDPYHNPDGLDEGKLYDTIMCNYVLNVIVDAEERYEVIAKIRSLLKEGGIAYISVRNDIKNLNGYTSIGTWQGFIHLPYTVYKRSSQFVMYIIDNNRGYYG